MEKRVYKRFNVEFPALYKAPRSPLSPYESTVVDVGAEGLCFWAKGRLNVGDVVELIVYLDPERKAELKTVVMQTKEVEKEKYKVGVEIVDATQDDERKFIQYYCDKMLSFPGERKKILVIEDEKDMARLLQIELEKENYNVIAAYDGEEGLSKYFNEHPHLIILDLMLPKMSGHGVCRKIRREEHDTQTPILMLTAKKEDTDRIIGRVIGAERYMTKPFEVADLLREIEELLSRSEEKS